MLAYPEIIRTGTVERLIGLLSHENMDIAIDVVEVINEFTDEDAGNDAEDEEEEEEQGSREDALKQLIESFVSGSAAVDSNVVSQKHTARELYPRAPCGQLESLQRGRGV